MLCQKTLQDITRHCGLSNLFVTEIFPGEGGNTRKRVSNETQITLMQFTPVLYYSTYQRRTDRIHCAKWRYERDLAL